MAERRMFAKTIIDSDAFIDMPVTARLLYYDLAMRADDDGFVNSPKKIMRMIGASQDDMSILIMRKFIIPFDNGIVVIKHWRIHNYIRKDTYNSTPYVEEKAMLELDENRAYTLKKDIPELPVNEPSTCRGRVVDTGKVRLGKDSKDNNISAEFEELWSIYPRKQGKKNALASYERARKNGATFEMVKHGIEAYVRYIMTDKVESQYIKQGSTFFNQQAWQDDWTPRGKVAQIPEEDILDGIL